MNKSKYLQKYEIGSYIDHTVLKTDSKYEDIIKACNDALKYDFHSVCVRPRHVKIAHNVLYGSSVAVCCAVGFDSIEAIDSPLFVKEDEIFRSLDDGAIEFDVMMNINAMNNRKEYEVLYEIQRIREDCGTRTLKLILETSKLTKFEISQSCYLAKAAGVDFVKSSSGFHGNPTLDDIRYMVLNASPEIDVKASGGIKTLRQMKDMIDQGASRIGTSNSVAIVREFYDSVIHS